MEKEPTTQYQTIQGKDLSKSFKYVKIKDIKSDDQIISVNHQFIALSWESSFSSICILPKDNPRGVPPDTPLIRVLGTTITSVRWSPMVKNLLASSFEDGTVRLWKIPEGGLRSDIRQEDQKFIEHLRKVNLMKFHPSSAEVIASCSKDQHIKVWNIEKAKSYFTINCPEYFSCLDWNYDGSIIGGCHSGPAYLYDPRTTQEIGHVQLKNKTPGRVFFVGKENFCTIGNEGQGRFLKLFDIKKMDTPIKEMELDKERHQCFPYYDYDSGIIYIPSKGSPKVHIYFYLNGTLNHYYKAHQLPTPATFCTFEDKRCVDYQNNEMTKLYRYHNDALTMTSFYVIRKAGYDPALFPDSLSGESALTGDEWASGTNKDPITKPISEVGAFEGEENINLIKPGETSAQDNEGEVNIEEKIRLLKEENEALKEKLTEQRCVNEELEKELQSLKASA